MKLVSIILLAPQSLPGVRIGQNSTLTPGDGIWVGWRFFVRGPRVVLVSPPGWKPGTSKDKWSGGESVMFDIPREQVTCMWSGGESDVDAISKWSPPPPPKAEEKAEMEGDDVDVPMVEMSAAEKKKRDPGRTANAGSAKADG